jgi:hypothetical protein
MILGPRLIEECVNEISRTGADALYVHEIVLGSNIFCRVRNFERSFYSGTLIDGARFFKRDIFLKTGGFDEVTFRSGSGEDWDLDKMIRRDGGRIMLLPISLNCSVTEIKWVMSQLIKNLNGDSDSNLICIYHNESNIKFKSYLRKKIYYATGFDGYVQKWGEEDQEIRKQLGLWYRYFQVFFENKKWLILIKKPHLTLMMYCLRFAVGFVFITRNLKFRGK